MTGSDGIPAGSASRERYWRLRAPAPWPGAQAPAADWRPGSGPRPWARSAATRICTEMMRIGQAGWRDRQPRGLPPMTAHNACHGVESRPGMPKSQSATEGPASPCSIRGVFDRMGTLSSLHPVRLYTVGHSNQTLGQLVGLLQLHGINAVADVRSMPYSRRLPQFNRPELRRSSTTTASATCSLERS